MTVADDPQMPKRYINFIAVEVNVLLEATSGATPKLRRCPWKRASLQLRTIAADLCCCQQLVSEGELAVKVNCACLLVTVEHKGETGS